MWTDDGENIIEHLAGVEHGVTSWNDCREGSYRRPR